MSIIVPELSNEMLIRIAKKLNKATKDVNLNGMMFCMFMGLVDLDFIDLVQITKDDLCDPSTAEGIDDLLSALIIVLNTLEYGPDKVKSFMERFANKSCCEEYLDILELYLDSFTYVLSWIGPLKVPEFEELYRWVNNMYNKVMDDNTPLRTVKIPARYKCPSKPYNTRTALDKMFKYLAGTLATQALDGYTGPTLIAAFNGLAEPDELERIESDKIVAQEEETAGYTRARYVFFTYFILLNTLRYGVDKVKSSIEQLVNTEFENEFILKKSLKTIKEVFKNISCLNFPEIKELEKWFYTNIL